MTIPNGKLQRIKGYPAGINNVADETSLPKNEFGEIVAARQLVNVDLGPDGKPRRRAGYTLHTAMTRPHSGFGDWPGALLAVENNALVAFDANFTKTTVRSGLGPNRVSYAVVNADCYWTNGLQLRRLTLSMEDLHAAVPCPAQPAVAAHPTGALAEGTYQVAVTGMDASGMESGSTLATLVTLTAGQGIRLTNLIAPPECEYIRVYVSNANGDALYHARDIPAGISAWTIGAGTRGKLLETQFLLPLAPGKIVRFFNGRLLTADDTLRWSEAFRFGLMRANNYIRFGAETTLLEPVDGGVYVASRAFNRTLFLDGAEPSKWSQRLARPTGVVPGTGRSVPAKWFGLEQDGEVAFWLDTDGVFCLGLGNGQVVPITEGRVALPNYEQGAVLLQERAGIRQIIAAMLGGSANNMAASDSAVATVRRHGAAADL